MAQVTVNRSKLQEFLAGPQMQRFLTDKSRKILDKMSELAPKDTGTLANSFSAVLQFQAGRLVVQIVSSDPDIGAIINGTEGPYRGIPPWGPGSQLGGWMERHGIVTQRGKYQMAVHISKVGTKPNREWIAEAVKAAL